MASRLGYARKAVERLPNVADMATSPRNVRFSPNNGHWAVKGIHHSRRPRKRSCDSITDSSSSARFNPARPRLGLPLQSFSMRRSAAATRSRARCKSMTVYCRGSGRVRFFRGPLVVLGTSMAALSCFPVAIVPLPVHLRRYVWTRDNCRYGVASGSLVRHKRGVLAQSAKALRTARCAEASWQSREKAADAQPFSSTLIR